MVKRNRSAPDRAPCRGSRRRTAWRLNLGRRPADGRPRTDDDRVPTAADPAEQTGSTFVAATAPTVARPRDPGPSPPVVSSGRVADVQHSSLVTLRRGRFVAVVAAVSAPYPRRCVRPRAASTSPTAG